MAMERYRGIDPIVFADGFRRTLDFGISWIILGMYSEKNRDNPDALKEAARLAESIHERGGFLNLNEADKEDFRKIAHTIVPPKQPIQLSLRLPE